MFSKRSEERPLLAIVMGTVSSVSEDWTSLSFQRSLPARSGSRQCSVFVRRPKRGLGVFCENGGEECALYLEMLQRIILVFLLK